MISMRINKRNRACRLALCYTVAYFQVVGNTIQSFAQSSPGLSFGQVPTAGQWNSYFSGKADYPVLNTGLANAGASSIKCNPQTVNAVTQDCSVVVLKTLMGGLPISVLDPSIAADPTGILDSSAAFNNALTSLPARGGEVWVPCGTYLINFVRLGNGSSGTASTLNGMKIVGLGAGIQNFHGASRNPSSCVNLNYSGSPGGTMIQVAGIVQGWGLENLTLNGSATGGAQANNCIQIVSGQYGFAKNLSFNNCLVSYQYTTWPVLPPGFSTGDTIHNTAIGLNVIVPNSTNAIGIAYTGQGTAANSDYNLTMNYTINMPSSVGVVTTAVYQGFADSNTWMDGHVFGGTASTQIIVNDYTVVSGFPTANMFYSLDPSGSLAPPARYVNIGSPSGVIPHMIYGLMRANGAGFPNVAALCASDATQMQLCGTATNPASFYGITTVSGLPACNAAALGSRAFVVDANSVTFHATAVGGGTNPVAVACSGTVWYID